ncbi:MAG: DUF4199 domain-containing protein [Chitinophagaceae bacterium]
MNNIAAKYKGLITGAIMIAISMGIFAWQKSFDSSLQNFVYVTYVIGIIWTLFSYKQQTNSTATFKAYFSESFKCFIVVTLMMVLFTLFFILLHPELKEQMGVLMREDMVKMKDQTPLDIENSINSAKKFFLPGYLMAAVLANLFIGTLVTVITGGFLSTQRRN